MTKKYEILLKYIKDLSVEIPSPDVFIFSKEFITKYRLGINVTTEPTKNSMLEVITKLHYKDPSENKRKSYFEITYGTVIKILDKNLEKRELEKIILVEVQNEIYPGLEEIFLSTIKNAGFPDLHLEKKVDFEKLYKQKLS